MSAAPFMLPRQLPHPNKGIVADAKQIFLAQELIRLGARLKLIEAETTLSRDRLIDLHKEVSGLSPLKGMLPASTHWFMERQPNIHSSLFYGIHRFVSGSLIEKQADIKTLIKSYRLYAESVSTNEAELVLSFTRAWVLVRLIETDVLHLRSCDCCSGNFVDFACNSASPFVCQLCQSFGLS